MVLISHMRIVTHRLRVRFRKLNLCDDWLWFWFRKCQFADVGFDYEVRNKCATKLVAITKFETLVQPLVGYDFEQKSLVSHMYGMEVTFF